MITLTDEQTDLLVEIFAGYDAGFITADETLADLEKLFEGKHDYFS